MTESMHTTVVSESVGVFPNIEALAAEHDRLTGEIARLPQTAAGDEDAKHLNDRQWEIRALIAATLSYSQSELNAKARIFQAEAARDADFECDCPGSARALARSIAADVMSLKVTA